MSEFAVYAGLFAVAFVAATILPAQSELGLAALLMCRLAARLGAAGGGKPRQHAGGRGQLVPRPRHRERYGGRRWFPASEKQIERASRWYAKWGRWSLLLSWMPIGGDALTVVAGVLREPFPSFLALVAIAKTARYLVVAAITLSWF